MLSGQERKDILSKRGVSLVAIARGENVSPTAVQKVIGGDMRSRRIELAIAKAMRLPVSKAFPPPRPVGRPRKVA